MSLQSIPYTAQHAVIVGIEMLIQSSIIIIDYTTARMRGPGSRAATESTLQSTPSRAASLGQRLDPPGFRMAPSPLSRSALLRVSEDHTYGIEGSRHLGRHQPTREQSEDPFGDLAPPVTHPRQRLIESVEFGVFFGPIARRHLILDAEQVVHLRQMSLRRPGSFRPRRCGGWRR